MSQIPNTLTILNLLSGCIGIVMAFSGKLDYAAYLVWTAAVFDFLDGFAARLMKKTSPLGKELDSLADIVSFGVLPAVIMYILIEGRTDKTILPFLAFALAIFSAIRLAKFNIDTQQDEVFRGLPTPANALFISGLPFVLNTNFIDSSNFLTAEVLLAISIGLSILLITRIPLFSLKFKGPGVKNNAIQIAFLGTSVVLLLLFKAVALPLIIILYLIFSMVFNFIMIK